MTSRPDELSRRLRFPDAVMIGVGSMLGAGVFVAFGPAAAAAGTGLLVALAVAAAVAYLNATASAQLAAASPRSGGTYVYGRERLGPGWGFAAGWAFLIGKTASCAAMATTVAVYAVPGPDEVRRVVAVAVVLVLTTLNYRGITRTVALTRVLVCLTLSALAVVVAGIILGSGGSTDHLAWSGLDDGGWGGTLEAAALLFFAFAGYARLATLGEEVVDPARTIPRAVVAALVLTVTIYLIVGVAVLYGAGPDRLATSAAPLVAALDATDQGSLEIVARAGAVVAALGALLSLIAGVSRTALAMSRERDLPTWLAAVHPRHRVPHHAEIALAAVVSVLVLTVDLRDAIGFSSFGVLLYYAIAQLCALRQPALERRWPRWTNLLGLAGCLGLVAALPTASIVIGLVVLTSGLVGRVVATSVRRRGPGRPTAPR